MTEQGESLLEILDDLITTVEQARTLPMSASVVVNRSEMLDLLETARDIVPDQIVAADSVLSEAAAVGTQARADAEGIVNQAHRDADQILSEAREQASRLVAQDSVTITAKSQASRILDEAKSEAAKLRSGANDYSQNVLAELANQLEHIQDQIVAGRQVLTERSVEEDDQPEE